MTTLTSGANGATNNFDSSQLIGLSTAALGTHTTTTFTLTVDGFTVVGQGTGFTYSSGHPGGGTLTALSIDTNGTPASWSGFSVSVATLWQAIAAGDTATFNNLFFSGNDTFNMQASHSPDFLSGYGGNDTFNYGDYFTDFTNIDGGTGTDTLNLNGDYGFRALGYITNVETINLGGGHNYDLLMSPTSAVTVNGSALGVGDVLKFDGAWVGTGALLITGGSGSDIFISGHGNDTFNGGPGTDTVDYSHATSGVTVNLSLTTAQGVGGGAGSDTLISVEKIIGSGYDDSLTGNASDNVLIGGEGHDTLNGGAGNDTASYQDVQLLSGAHGVTIDLRPGGSAGTDTLISIESVIGSQLGDTFIGNTDNNTFDAGGCANAAYDTITYQYATGGMTFNMTSFTGFGSTIVVTGGGQGTDSLVDFTRIIGTGFDDTFYLLSPANLTIEGGGGTDLISFQNAASFVAYGLGSDVAVENLTGTAFDDQLDGDLADNVIHGGDGADEISGGSSATDTSDGNDTIYGDAGNDTISGYGGSDTIYGGVGDDVLSGGGYALTFDGNDKIYGGDGNDTLFSGGLDGENLGNVLMDGGAGDDTFWGADGSDTATYQDATGGVTVDLSSTDVQAVGGGQGSDTLRYVDNLIGSSFDDLLTSGDGDNVLTGGAGNDVLDLSGWHDQFASVGHDTADGGSGVDTVGYQHARAGVTVSLAVTTAQAVGGGGPGGGAVDTLVSIENLIGSVFDDTLSGSDFTNVITTLSGNDAVNGLGGNDTIQLDSWLTAADSIDGGAGQDILDLDGDYSAGVIFTATTLVNVEKIVVGDGFDYRLTSHDATLAAGQFLTVDASALGAGNRLIFNGAAETDGTFILRGGSGNDALTGGLGNDYFYPGSGADTITGGNGNDSIIFTSGFDASDQIDGAAGADTLYLTADYSAGVIFAATTLVDLETIILGAGFNYQLATHDATVAAGQFLKVDASNLGAGNGLSFNGAAETDGAFVLKGGSGNDALTGGFGNDYFYPGFGADTVTGGSGNDSIVFTTGFDAGDRLDGAVGVDTLYLTADYSAGLSFTATTLVNVEKIVLGAGFDYRLATHEATVAAGQILTVDASHLGAGNKLIFNGASETDGSFTVKGGAGNDDVTTGSGDDTIVAGAGVDVVHPGSGNDFVLGGDGNDFISFGKYLTALDRIDGGAGTADEVVLHGDYSTPLVFSATTMINVEYLVVGAGNDYALTTHNKTVAAGQTLTVDASALGGANKLLFNGDAETNGNFVILGGAGRDRIIGGDGADVLTGGGGGDNLIGGLGADRLTGNAGANKFVYFAAAESTGNQYDTLVGFDFALDKINAPHRIKAIDAAISSGPLSAATFETDLSTALDGAHLDGYHAALFTPTAGGLAGQTFLIVDANGIAGYQAGQDFVFHLEGAVNLAGLDVTDIV